MCGQLLCSCVGCLAGFTNALSKSFPGRPIHCVAARVFFALSVGSGRVVWPGMRTTGVGGGSRGIGGNSITCRTGREEEDGVATGIVDDAALDRVGRGPDPESSKPILSPEPLTEACNVNAAVLPSAKDRDAEEDAVNVAHAEGRAGCLRRAC